VKNHLAGVHLLFGEPGGDGVQLPEGHTAIQWYTLEEQHNVGQRQRLMRLLHRAPGNPHRRATDIGILCRSRQVREVGSPHVSQFCGACLASQECPDHDPFIGRLHTHL
jgi:hypothetical protein